MNLKEAFRFQKKLTALIAECCQILSSDNNTTETKSTYLRKKVMEGAEDAEIVEQAPSKYADRINGIVSMMLHLLEEQERLYAATRIAKAALDIDFDAEAGLNRTRHDLAGVLRYMADIRPSEAIVPNGGYGYCFNADGNQVTYKCDIRRVTTINFDRNAVRNSAVRLSRKADEISSRLDQALVNTAVDYDPPFDVNDTFADVVDLFAQA